VCVCVTGSAVRPGPPLQRRAEPALTRSLAAAAAAAAAAACIGVASYAAAAHVLAPPLSTSNSLFFFYHTLEPMGGPVADWLACWTQAQKGPGSNRSRDAVM